MKYTKHNFCYISNIQERIRNMQYENVITEVLQELYKDTEWQDRYKNYIEEINTKAENNTFKNAQNQFALPAPFHLYMPLSMVINDCSSKRTVFDLRFHGQSVANLLVSNNEQKKVYIKIKKNQAVYNALIDAGMTKEANTFGEIVEKTVDWHSKNAKDFRKIYADLEEKLEKNPQLRIKGQPEHELESELLKNYSQKSSAKKEFSFIQPVMMRDTHARFQMPTPIKASNLKNDMTKPSNSKSRGGGIDILARIGSGYKTKLAVIELKDENTKSEPPHKAIRQAIAYATFLRELIRSDSGKDWWEFFGFGRDIPEELIIKAIIAMPYRNKKGEVDEHTTEFINFIEHTEIDNKSKTEKKINKKIKIGETDDYIELEYIFRDPHEEVRKSF